LGKKSERVTTIRRVTDSPLSVINYQVRGPPQQTTQATPQQTHKPLMPNASENIKDIPDSLPRPYFRKVAQHEAGLMRQHWPSK